MCGDNFEIVTGSAKAQHSHASLNFQYELLNTIGENTCVSLKNNLNAWFKVKEWSNIKILGIMLFA